MCMLAPIGALNENVIGEKLFHPAAVPSEMDLNARDR